MHGASSAAGVGSAPANAADARKGGAVLACVGPDTGDEVLHAAARLAGAMGTPWHAVYVETPALARLPDERREAILRRLKSAEDLGATTATVAAQEPAEAVVEHARARHATTLVMGLRPHDTDRRVRFGRGLGERVSAQAPTLVLVRVPSAGDAAAPRRARGEPGPTVRWSRYAWALAICAVATAVAALLFPYLDLANIVMVFLLGVVLAAIRLGRGPAITAVVISVLCFDVFFVPPYFSLAVSNVQYLVTFGVMLVVGVTIAELTARLRYQARVSAYREERAANLFALGRELSGALTTDQVVKKSVPIVEATFRARADVLACHDSGTLAVDEGRARAFDRALAELALGRGEPVGIGSAERPDAPALYMPLKAPMRTRGVLVVRPENPRLLRIPEQRRLVETIATLVAIALERIHYVKVAQQTLLGMESERLRSSLLGALSHDIRTPLTALVGLAETLSMRVATAAPEAAREADQIRDQARRIGQLVENLLEMARLQGGAVKLNHGWQSIEELVGSAIESLGSALDGRPIETDVPATLPLVWCDAVLIERVLANLLENASKYTPPASRIAIAAKEAGDEIVVTVSDEGPGVPRGQEQTIFGKFQRGERESAIPGVGLGLAIARAIVEAHRGRISVENRRDARGEVVGAAFSFTLPLESVPPVEPESAADEADIDFAQPRRGGAPA
jgi:two-component system sensor histidine kinase KdpD